VPTSAVPVSQSERAALADLLEQLGPDQPTCCEGWTTRDIATHLVVRDRRPDAMPGLALGGPFASWTQRLHDRSRSARPYGVLVAEVRSGPPRWLPTSWPALDRALNTAEMVIHHEDVRRAQPGWVPRRLPREVQDELWNPATLFARRTRGGVVLRRTDVDGVEQRIGSGTRTVAGEPMEVLLWAAGRRGVARVTVT
jgi:uncharacterized protein (TIGR03085 family)